MIMMSHEQYERLNRLGRLSHVHLEKKRTQARDIQRYLMDEVYDPDSSSMWFMQMHDKSQILIVSFTSEVQALAFQLRWL